MRPAFSRSARRHALPALLLLAALASPAAQATEPFTLTLDILGRRMSGSGHDAMALLKLLQPGSAATAALPPPGLPYTVSLMARGVAIRFDIAAVTGAIRLRVPAAGVDITFNSGSPVASRDALIHFIQGQGDREALKRIMSAAVRTTTLDPVAGAPTAMLERTAVADFNLGLLPPGDAGDMTPRAAGWHAALGAAFMAQREDTPSTTVPMLPLSLSYAFGEDGPEALFDLQLERGNTGGGKRASASGALGVRLPLLTTPDLRWSVTPALRLGAVSSAWLAAAARVQGAAVTSDLRIALPGEMVLALGSGVGHYQTRPMKLRNYDVLYELDNTAWRNSASLSWPMGRVADRPLRMAAGIADTRLNGHDTAVPSWQEYSLSAVLGRAQPVRLSLGYLAGEGGYHAFQAGLSVAF
ncbi:hypothetical protein NON00_11695 [Roseomonas sp. GC11]|uniref:hypothetical protein n=1 Tax=Roseomonas sp. GC11 TaxID=2950546 RepID=UPI002109D189|nr:hypothetical protein [Roseomonas sp. GC11]MCQ4160590.1 hypothetical protein [Roseomonas sp. GC11]